ncbi:TolC family protein [Stappia indica]|uniref:Protein CyaE n=1 Tax=Stappia indica TaxID=538381 RepID=A0A857C6P3_9HYPH|nr:TolC family protein [Stappia indica]QGZ34696.1 TolC family protein [Stappia indica]
MTSTHARRATLLFGCVLLSGCLSDPSKLTSSAPDKPWGPSGDNGSFAVHGSINDTPATTSTGPRIQVQSGKVYTLSELIDLGQRSHPSTRVAWEQARQAAAAVGIAEGTFLPMISANVIAGYQDVVTPLPTLFGGTDYVSTKASGVTPNIALQWLLFDFGERQALLNAAQQTAFAANISFNGTHQALIHDITRAYYLYGVARQKSEIAEHSLANSRKILAAAEGRYSSGIGTSIEVAQAKQLVAQSRFRLVQARDGLDDAYQGLTGAVGLAPNVQIKVASSTSRRLPGTRGEPTDKVVQQALSRRPDVLASYAALKASEANERAAAAAFLPKVYLGAVAVANRGRVQAGSLPGAGLQSTASGVMLGVTVPLFDGQIRKNRQRQAASATRAAAAVHRQTKDAAIREILLASNSVRSALASYEAASELRRASIVTYNAAFEAYQNGLGTLTDVTAADSSLLDAREAQADAHAASLLAASSLAFMLGNMTSSSAPEEALR